MHSRLPSKNMLHDVDSMPMSVSKMTFEFDRQNERAQMLSVLARAPASRRTQLIEEYQRRSESAFAPATLKNYRMVVRLFGLWCADRGHSPEPPVSPEVLAKWVDDTGGKLAANTIETRLWGISEMHRCQFLPSPTNHRLVDLALKAVKRKYGAGQRQAQALGKKEVLAAIARLGSSRLEKRDKALLWIMTDSWCRVSEVIAFKVSDLVRQDDGSSLLFVRRSKTDQYGDGAYAFLSERGSIDVLDWIDTAGRLCCTKRVRDSCREFSVVAGSHEQTDIIYLQDDELG